MAVVRVVVEVIQLLILKKKYDVDARDAKTAEGFAITDWDELDDRGAPEIEATPGYIGGRVRFLA